MQMEHPRAGFVTVNRRLDLLVPSHGNIAISRQVLWTVGSSRDDKGIHVLRKQHIVGVIHFVFLLFLLDLIRLRRRKSSWVLLPDAKNVLCWIGHNRHPGDLGDGSLWPHDEAA